MGGTSAETLRSGVVKDFINFLTKKIEALEALQREKTETLESVEELVCETLDYWNANYLTFAKACMDRQRLRFEQTKFFESHGKVGRNDPCPCGSTKKFKKCCLLKYSN